MNTMLTKLRFSKYHTITVEAKRIIVRVVYGNFPFGYGWDKTCIPELAVDSNGVVYRSLTTCPTTGPWGIADRGDLQRVGLSAKQIRSVMTVRCEVVTA